MNQQTSMSSNKIVIQSNEALLTPPPILVESSPEAEIMITSTKGKYTLTKMKF